MKKLIIILLFFSFSCKKKQECWRVINWWYFYPSQAQRLVIAKGNQIDTITVNKLYNLGDLYCY